MRNLIVAISMSCLFGPLAFAGTIAQPGDSKALASDKPKAEASGNSAKSVKSAKSSKITEARALQMISRRPEVRSWQHQIEQSKIKGVSAHVALDRTEAGEYVVHVYEEVPDPDSSHTATLNWYYVNLRTGKVRTEF